MLTIATILLIIAIIVMISALFSSRCPSLPSSTSIINIPATVQYILPDTLTIFLPARSCVDFF